MQKDRGPVRLSATEQARRTLQEHLTRATSHQKYFGAADERNRQIQNYLGRLSDVLTSSKASEELAALSKAMRPQGSIHNAFDYDRLAEMVERGRDAIQASPIPTIRNDVAKSPLLETNRLLETLRKDIQALIGIQAQQTEVVNTVLVAITDASLSSDRAAKFTRSTTLLGLAVSLISLAVALIALWQPVLS